MRNITLNTGKNVIINENSLSDMMEAVRTELSPELADSLEEMISEKTEELEAERAEMRSYESNLEDAERSLRDIWEDAEDLLYYIVDSKRINKEWVTEKIREIRSTAMENL